MYHLPFKSISTLLVMFLLGSCQMNQPEVITPFTTPLAIVKGNSITKLKSDEFLANILVKNMRKNSLLFNESKYKFDEIDIQISGEHYYLLGRLKQSDKHKYEVVAIDLKDIENQPRIQKASFDFFFTEYGNDYPTLGEDEFGEVHTCQGAPCSSCAFIRDRTGKITGCTCNDGRGGFWSGGNSSGSCNHIVMSN